MERRKGTTTVELSTRWLHISPCGSLRPAAEVTPQLNTHLETVSHRYSKRDRHLDKIWAASAWSEGLHTNHTVYAIHLITGAVEKW